MAYTWQSEKFQKPSDNESYELNILHVEVGSTARDLLPSCKVRLYGRTDAYALYADRHGADDKKTKMDEIIKLFKSVNEETALSGEDLFKHSHACIRPGKENEACLLILKGIILN